MPGVVVPPNWLSPSHGVTPSLSSRWSGKSPLSFENLRTGLKRGTCNAKGQAKPSPNVKAQMTNEIQNPNDKDFITPLAPLILRGGKTRRLLRPEKAGLAMTKGIIRGGLRTARGGRTIPGHSERASAMEKPTGDGLRHQTAIFWFSILRVSTAIARAKTTFPDVAS